MKRLFPFIIFFLFTIGTSGQNLHLKISGSTETETHSIDSLGYTENHPNAKSVTTEIRNTSERLKKAGWLSTEIIEDKRVSDSMFAVTFSLGKKTNSIHIYIGINSAARSMLFPEAKTDTVTLPFAETEPALERWLKILESRGYPLANLQLANLQQQRNKMTADLILETGKPRVVNDIVINGYDKFPGGHKAQVKKLFRNKTFNKENLNRIYSEFEKFRFVRQTKFPEILFTEDTTKIYVYLEKAKPNRFDGFIGFSNDEDEGTKSKIRFNGYIDLLLVNILNSGEQFSLYWKSDGKDQKTFNAGIELPYIFKSPLGFKAGLNIFKQDSTYQNTKTMIGLGYFFSYNTRLYLNYEATESSDIQNANTAAVSDFKNSFVTTTFEFTDYRPEDFLFPEKTKLVFRTGIGSRKSKLETDPQFLVDATLSHNFYLDARNSVNLRTQDFFLKSDNYLVSELYRFGGINSIRGFNENSLQANLFTSLLTEYRYNFVPGMYVHSIIDYGYFRDETRPEGVSKNGNLLGVGIGFGFLGKNGLLNIVYANGTSDGDEIMLSNSIVHVSFKANF